MIVLDSSPFSDVEKWVFAREQQRSAASIVGEVVSSATGAIDDGAAERLLSALEPHLTNGALAENVTTTAPSPEDQRSDPLGNTH